MKLDINTLGPYLPFKLMVKTQGTSSNIPDIIELTVDNFHEMIIERKRKPLLRPMYLNIEIEHKGEKFIPKDRLSYNLQMNIDVFSLPHINNINYGDIQKLLEWHFYIFGLGELNLSYKL